LSEQSTEDVREQSEEEELQQQKIEESGFKESWSPNVEGCVGSMPKVLESFGVHFYILWWRIPESTTAQ